jgi:hypothetical protein
MIPACRGKRLTNALRSGSLMAVNTAEESVKHKRVRHWTATAIILLATLLAYLPVWRGGFIWDDAVSLTDNPLIPRRDGL